MGKILPWTFFDHNWRVIKDAENWLRSHSQLFRGVVVDLGCGERAYEEFILKTADKYIGVDWSESIHEHKADIISDLNQPLQIDSQQADTVISFSVLEHLNEPQVMLESAYNLLKPGGKLIIQVPFQWRVHEAPHDYYRFTPFGLKHLLTKAGFTEIVIFPSGGFFTTWITKLNYFTIRAVRGPFWLKRFIKMAFLLLWIPDQLFAPLLDKLDRHWELEAPGYWVTAKK